MVLFILALAWATVLFFWFRSRSQGSWKDSVSLFHRDLRMIERAAPAASHRARRRGAPYVSVWPVGGLQAARVGASGVEAIGDLAGGGAVAGGDSCDADSADRGTRDAGGDLIPNPLSASRRAGARLHRGHCGRRRNASRRRNVLLVLSAVVAAGIVGAAITRTAPILMAQGATDVVWLGYVGLLVLRRRRAEARSPRLDPLVTPAPAGPAHALSFIDGHGARPPVYAMAAGYDGDDDLASADYDEVVLRRAVGN